MAKKEIRIIYTKNGIFKVQSESNPSKFYEVDLKYSTDGICTCYSFIKNHVFCKHIKELKSRLKDNGVGIEWS